jgi:hypothetical protein
MVGRQFIRNVALASLLAIAGCAAHELRMESDAMYYCEAEVGLCSPKHFSWLSSRDISSLPSPLRVSCSGVRTVTPRYEAKCREAIAKALLAVSERIPTITPLSPPEIHLEMDTLYEGSSQAGNGMWFRSEYLYTLVSTR